MNYQFDYAIENYKKFKANLQDARGEKDIDHQIEMCNYAKEIVAAPVTIQIENLGPNINSSYADYSPVLAADEATIFFTSRRPETTGKAKDPNDSVYYLQLTSDLRSIQQVMRQLSVFLLMVKNY